MKYDIKLRSLWISCITLGILGIVSISWWVGSLSILMTMPIKEKLSSVRAASDFDLDTAASIADTTSMLEEIKRDIEPATKATSNLYLFSPSLSWIPALGEGTSTWSAQMYRLELDLGSAIKLLSASTQLLDSYQQIESAFRTSKQVDLLSLQYTQQEILSIFSSELETLHQASTIGKTQKPMLITPDMEVALEELEEVELAMSKSARIGYEGSLLLGDILTIIDIAQPLTELLSKQQSNSTSTLTNNLTSTVANLDNALQFALMRSEGLEKLVTENKSSEQLSERLKDAVNILGALELINSAIEISLEVLGPALSKTEGNETSLLGNEGTLVTALNSVNAKKSTINHAISLLTKASNTLLEPENGNGQPGNDINSEYLVQIANVLSDGLHLLGTFAPLANDLIGVEEIRRYLILGQSADELRATGGFVSGVWLITFEAGKLSDVRYHDAVLVDDWTRLELYPQAPFALEEHMNASVWLLRDVSWEPDFPTTARIAQSMYDLGQRTKVDGVVALNQWFLLDIINSLEGISSPTGTETITSQNLLPNLEKGTDIHGRAYADLTVQGILQRLNESADIVTLLRLGSAIHSSLQSRNLLLQMNNPELQSIIESNGWGGQINRGTGDYLYVVDSNIGWSKSDRNIEREIHYKIDLRRESGPRISLNIGYNNHSGPGSPGCFPQWRNRGTDYSSLKNACLWNYWRVYVPKGAKLRSNSDLPLPDLSVAVEINRGIAGENTIQSSSNYQKIVFSGLFALEAGAQQNVSLVYDLPPENVKRKNNTIEYNLTIQKQPGVTQRNTHIEFLLPPGFKLDYSSMIATSNIESKVSFFTPLKEDVIMKSVFSKDGNE